MRPNNHHGDVEGLGGISRRAWQLLVGLVIFLPVGAATTDEVDRVDLTLKGGPHVGSYSITSRLGCEFTDHLDGLEGEPPAFMGGFFTETSPGSQSGLQPHQLGIVTLIIPNIETPREDVFLLEIVFGYHGSGESATVYEIYTIPLEMRSDIDLMINGEKPMTGHGRVSVDRSGRQTRIRFSGETEDAVKIEGVIQCNSLRR